MPKISFHNWRREFPTASATAYRRWFHVDRFWGGQIVHINVRHFTLALDFRKDVAGDLARRAQGRNAAGQTFGEWAEAEYGPLPNWLVKIRDEHGPLG